MASLKGLEYARELSDKGWTYQPRRDLVCGNATMIDPNTGKAHHVYEAKEIQDKRELAMETVEIRSQLKQAMKSGDTVRTSILRLLLGEVDTLEAVGKKADIFKIIKKLIDSNIQTLAIRADEKLVKENEILNGMLPKELTKQEVLDIISFNMKTSSTFNYSFTTAKSEGQAIGIAVKAMKETKLAYNSNELIEIVKEIRNGKNEFEPKKLMSK